jgi:hypothetical protein
MTEGEDQSYYPSKDVPQVIRHEDRPPAYAIFPTYPGVSKLITELDMPTESDVIYNLSYLSVEDFLNFRGYSYVNNIRRSQYSVELLGLLIKLPENFCLGMTVPRPDPSLYKCEPRYCIEHGFRLVQIWRLRVYTCPLENIETSCCSPFGKFPSGTLYVEERWHPLADTKRRLIGGIETVSKNKGLGLDRFYADALPILEGNFKTLKSDVKMGRTQGTTYYTATEFPHKLREAYQKLYDLKDEKPKQEAVAVELKIGLSTLRRYLRNLKISWPPID